MKKDKLKKYLKSFVIFTLVASLSVSISGCSKKEEFPLLVATHKTVSTNKLK